MFLVIAKSTREILNMLGTEKIQMSIPCTSEIEESEELIYFVSYSDAEGSRRETNIGCSNSPLLHLQKSEW